MKMNSRTVSTALAMGLLVAISGTAYAMASRSPDNAAMDKHPAMTTTVYVCPACHQVYLKAGTCACGKTLEKTHLLGTKDGQAMLCACGADCKCDFKGVKDGKCACGKEVKMASCKGLYCCPQGCPVMSETPGKCACGMEMKKTE